jgi:hypothetical protein
MGKGKEETFFLNKEPKLLLVLSRFQVPDIGSAFACHGQWQFVNGRVTRQVRVRIHGGRIEAGQRLLRLSGCVPSLSDLNQRA